MTYATGADPYLGSISPANIGFQLDITDLEHTRRYMDNERELHNKLVARGRRYFELNKEASLQDYYGESFPRVYKDVSTLRQPNRTEKS